MTFGLIGGLGVPELLLIFGIIVVIFGANKLPGLGKAVGQSIKEFKSSVKDGTEEQPAEDKKAE